MLFFLYEIKTSLIGLVWYWIKLLVHKCRFKVWYVESAFAKILLGSTHIDSASKLES